MKRERGIKIPVKVAETPKSKHDKNTIVVTETVEEVVKESKPKWLVVNGSITLLRDRSKSYGKGDYFEADESEVPLAFRDLVKMVSQPQDPKPVRTQPRYSLQPVVPTAEEEDESGYVQLYEIVNARDKVISEKPLPKNEAEEILIGLNA